MAPINSDAELAEIRERHRLSFEHAPTGQALVALDGSWLSVNPALCRLLGVRAEDLRGKRFQDVTHPDDLAADLDHVERLLAGDTGSFFMEKRYLRSDGAVVWANLHVSLVRSRDGRPLHFVSQVEDITDRRLKQAEFLQVSEELRWANRALHDNIAKALANEGRYRTLLDHLPGTVAYVLERKGTIVAVSGAGLPPSGTDESSVLGRTVDEVFTPGDALVLRKYLRSAFEGQPVSAELILGKSRSDYLVDLVTVEPAWGGEPTEALMLVRDISGRKDRERATVDAEARWRAAFVEAPVPMAELGLDGLVLRANRALCDLLGCRAKDVEDGSLVAWLHPDEQAAAAAKLARVAQHGPGESEWDQRFVTSTGSVRFVTVRASVLEGAGGSPTRLLVHLLDVTAEREQRQQVKAAHDRYSALIEHSSDLTTITDAEGTVVYASPAYEHLTGYRVEAALGASLSEMVHHAEVQRVQAALASVAGAPAAVARFACRLRHADGGWRHVEMVVANRLHDPAVSGLVLNARDVTESVEAASRLAHQAMHDSLTNLPNRVLLLRHLRDALARTEASGNTCGLLFVDLDHFKHVNDSFGHAVGDLLLVAFAGRLQEVTRPGDVVARLGGDEFVVLAENIRGPQGAVDIAERIRTRTREPVQLAGRAITIGCSVGIALSNGHDAETLLQEADTALFQAKERGRNRSELYDDAMRTQARRRLDTESLIRANLEGDGPLVLYQPIVDLRTGEVTGTEALARLCDTNGRLLGAAEFISVVEDSELIVPLGEAVLDRACSQLAKWSKWPAGPSRVSVNLSARQLLTPSLVEIVSDVLHRYRLRSEQLCLEITESALIDVSPVTGQSLRELKAMGVCLGIDDFGTGWSSLTYLRRFPIDIVKIDHSFVAGLGTTDEDTEVVRAIVGLGHALGLTTVAEGVERSDQELVLMELGCDFAQGHRYGPPQLPEDLRFDYVRLRPRG